MRLIGWRHMIAMGMLVSSHVCAQDHPASAATSEEIAVLQSQLALMQTHYTEILSTVYWSLGLVAALVVSMIAVGSYFNLRVYDRDKENLKSSLEFHLRARFAEEELRMKSEIEKYIDSLFPKKITDATKSLSSRMSTLDSKIDNINADYIQYRYEEQIKLAERAMSKKDSFKHYMNALDLVLRHPHHWYREIYADIVGEIEGLLRDGHIEPRHTEELSSLLEKLPKRFETNATRLKRALADPATFKKGD